MASGCERLIVVGGDGTVHHVLGPLAGSDTALGLVPAGRGNDLASALGVAGSVRRAWERALEGAPRRIDLGRTGNGVFAGVAGLGLASEVARVARGAAGRWRGPLAYPAALLRSLRVFEAPVVRIRVAGRTIERRICLLAVANAPSFGGGMRIAPQARLDDGVLDLVVVDRVSPLRLLRLFPWVYFGRHLGSREVSTSRVESFQVESDDRLELVGDGERMGQAQVRIDFGVARGALLVAA